MSKKFTIHDLDENDAKEVCSAFGSDSLVFAARPSVKHCIGCFGCWVKTPGQCIIADRCKETPAMMAASDELIIVSRIVYGGFSPDVKAVLDRSIAYVMPYFRIIQDEMHHTMRYDNPFKLSVHFYGDGIDPKERAIAQRIVKANALNFGSGSSSVSFHDSISLLKEAIA